LPKGWLRLPSAAAPNSPAAKPKKGWLLPVVADKQPLSAYGFHHFTIDFVKLK
jgi:hypothetical protein